ncbi:hemerythrin family protein [Marinobacterium sp. D7]|uniref:bacteriohemerythrin n=1 Tax=Marinobacterium ramblicola TaxID=2849041 RepID=UPI001C2DA4A6|nr:hemerythrin family protein [Marinobacterium ramblicola]MBV1787541.1 hemerythrin family protein [Marinobacterium ramblicola]
MTLLSTDTLPQVELDFMNEDHAEASALINLLNAALEQLISGGSQDRTAVTALLDQFYEHNRDHFAHEQAEMERTGFPAYPVHKGEHERVLKEFNGVIEAWREGMPAEALQNHLANSVVPWFINHIGTMDSVTAMFIERQG